MSYNPYGGVPGFGPPPNYGSYPGANGPPPGMSTPPGLGPPPGMSAPGMPPPGVQQPIINQANRPSGLPSNFQAPPNMPNINFNAPVIRLGTIPAKSSTPGMPGRRDSDAPQSGGPRSGIGMDRGLDQSRQAVRDSMQALVPPTKEDMVRTIFVQGITDGIGGNSGIERILNLVGNLRRWERATDSSGKELPFGFAQYEDAESLWVASELLREIQIPTKKQAPSEAPDDADDSYESFDKTRLQFKLDENTTNYLESYVEGRTNESEAEARLSAAIGALKQTVRNFFYPPLKTGADVDGDVAMGNAGQNGENVEVVNIPLAQDDELADIPAEMRETVAAEIAAFRDRSIKRDLERLKREEELEAMERQRAAGNRPSRLASPPPGAASNTNSTPLGPRGVPNAPSGPKGQKTDLGKDFNRSVNFVNGGMTNTGALPREDEDSDASDGELERRRTAKQTSETEKLYLDAERRWLNRERTRAAALERERERDETDEADVAKKREAMLDRFKHFDDDTEAARKKEEYYADRSAWIRNRTAFRAREVAADDADRAAEEQDRAAEEVEQEQARGMADSFLNEQAREITQRQPIRPGVAAPQPFKLSLGAAAQRAQAQRAAPQRKTVAEVEGLLEDEEEDNKKRTIIPIKFDPADAAGMSTEDREQAVRSLAQEIPNEKEGLWQWDIKWDFLDESVIRDKLRPFVEKKLVEYLGVQEELLIEVVEEHLRKHGKPGDLVETLAEALDDEAEALVKKLWRMVIFYTESEKRGLSA